MIFRHRRVPTFVPTALLMAAACGEPADARAIAADGQQNTAAEAFDDARDIGRAVCMLRAIGDSGVEGVVHFARDERGIRVTGTIRGLTPGMHGFHVHEFGDMQNLQDGSSAGGHFAPFARSHGKPTDDERHVGDLGNIEADQQGVAEIDVIDPELGFLGASSILGRSVVVHAGKDMFSQPSGDAGERVAVGVIGIAGVE